MKEYKWHYYCKNQKDVPNDIEDVLIEVMDIIHDGYPSYYIGHFVEDKWYISHPTVTYAIGSENPSYEERVVRWKRIFPRKKFDY